MQYNLYAAQFMIHVNDVPKYYIINGLHNTTYRLFSLVFSYLIYFSLDSLVFHIQFLYDGYLLGWFSQYDLNANFKKRLCSL